MQDQNKHFIVIFVHFNVYAYSICETTRKMLLHFSTQQPSAHSSSLQGCRCVLRSLSCLIFWRSLHWQSPKWYSFQSLPGIYAYSSSNAQSSCLHASRNANLNERWFVMAVRFMVLDCLNPEASGYIVDSIILCTFVFDFRKAYVILVIVLRRSTLQCY